MVDAAWTMYLVTVVLTAGYFFLTKRRFDFLTIAYIGAIFYFSPLFLGWVLQSGPNLTETIQPTVYLIATIFLLALSAAAILSRKSERPAPTSREPGRQLSRYYLLLALFGLVSSFVTTRGAIINVDKMIVLTHVGYFYVLFEVAATLACISAVIERRWWELAAALLLLFVDLIVGFRVFFTFAALCVTLVALMRDGELYLYKKLPTYGSAAAVLLVAMMSANAVRPLILDQITTFQSRLVATVAPAVPVAPVAQGGGIPGGNNQNEQSAKPGRAPIVTPAKPIEIPARPIEIPAKPRPNLLTSTNWIDLPYKLIQQSGEPFIVQATLVAVVQTGLSCSPSNIFKSLFLLVPPGMAKFAPTNSFPPTFPDEYQPIFYPGINYGTTGSIWAEMLCRFGYIGLAISGVLFVLVLLGLNRLLLRSSPMLTAPLTLGGTIIAFYINRNDLHFTLQMLKWVALVLLAAYLLSRATDMVRSASARLLAAS
jgi:hypothetical protein